MARRSVVVPKSPSELTIMARAGRVVAEVHDEVFEQVAAGRSTAELDVVAERAIRARGAQPSFKGYHGFPGSICASVNDEVVHGIPSPDRVLEDGDLLSVDVGAVVDGYHADAAVTWIVGGRGDPDSMRLVTGTRQALWAGLAAAVVGAALTDIGAAVEAAAHAAGLRVVPGYCGHGVGRALHEAPPVPNCGPAGQGPVLVPGIVLAVEPMLVLASPATREADDGWTVVTRDGRRSAHWEHTVAVTPDGPWVLTAREGEPAYALDGAVGALAVDDRGAG